MSIPETLAALTVPIDELKPYGKNPRRGNVALIAESLQQNGQYRPVVANRRTSEVLAGNHTVAAARSLGWSDLAVTWVDVDDEAAARIALVDNRASDLAGFDDQVLADLLQELPDLAGTGYSDDDLADLLSKVTELPPVLADPDDVPELPAEPKSVLGDVWQLGPHRVACGDSTVIDTLQVLMASNVTADLVLTDPPYGMSYDGGRGNQGGSGFQMIENDDLSGDALVALVRDALVAGRTVSKPDVPHYVFFTWRTYSQFEVALHDAALAPKACIVWDKGHFGLGHANYRPQHEFCFYVPGGQWYGDRAQADVWTISRGSGSGYKHPNQKPVELLTKALANSSKPGDVVLDFFGGSGSTLIACQVTGRVARLIELDPRYVDVICRRYQEISGDKPVLESTGEPHDFTAA